MTVLALTVTLGGIAGLIAAVALLVIAIFVGLVFFKLGRVIDELRTSVKTLTDETVPTLQELTGTVVATNDELGKIAVVTDDLATVSGKVTDVATDAARVSRLVADTVVVPFVKVAAIGRATKRAVKSLTRGKKPGVMTGPGTVPLVARKQK